MDQSPHPPADPNDQVTPGSDPYAHPYEPTDTTPAPQPQPVEDELPPPQSDPTEQSTQPMAQQPAQQPQYQDEPQVTDMEHAFTYQQPAYQDPVTGVAPTEDSHVASSDEQAAFQSLQQARENTSPAQIHNFKRRSETDEVNQPDTLHHDFEQHTEGTAPSPPPAQPVEQPAPEQPVPQPQPSEEVTAPPPEQQFAQPQQTQPADTFLRDEPDVQHHNPLLDDVETEETEASHNPLLTPQPDEPEPRTFAADTVPFQQPAAYTQQPEQAAAPPDSGQLQPPTQPNVQSEPPQQLPETLHPTTPQTAQNTDHTFQLPHTQATIQPGAVPANQPPPVEQPVMTPGGEQAAERPQQKLLSKIKKINYKPFAMSAVFGVVVFLIFNSQVLIGQIQYLTTPSGGMEAPEGGAAATAVEGDDRILIPKIDIDVPVVYDEPSFDEDRVQAALEEGVVHYGTTAMPGEIGNSVIVGHSSNNWWDSGKYKFAFILLDRLDNGDEIIMHYEGTRYVYEVTTSFVVNPSDVSVLDQPTDDSIITLITCTPPGTSWQRLIVQAEQVSPDPSDNTERGEESVPEATEALPSDSGQGFFDFLF